MTIADPQLVLDDLPAGGLPLEAGSVRLDSTGALRIEPPGDRALNFRFRFHELAFTGTAAREAGETVLLIETTLGILPYSAESATARQAMRQALREAARACPAGLRVTDRQEIGLRMTVPVQAPATPVRLLTALVLALLALESHLGPLAAALASARPARRTAA